MSRDELTDRQGQVLAAIRESIKKRGFPPTNRELRTALGIKSSNGVADHLRALERKGKIRCADKLSRGIEVLDQPEREALSTLVNVRAQAAKLMGRVERGDEVTREELGRFLRLCSGAPQQDEAS